MSVEPVTITTTHDTPLFDPEDHRAAAAEQLGVEPMEIHCISCGPDSVETVKQALYSEDGTMLKDRVLAYKRITIWAERPRAPRVEAAPAAVEEHPWPTLKLSRGARWHGPVTIDGVTSERYFISDGEQLQLMSSPEGKAVLDAMLTESATGG